MFKRFKSKFNKGSLLILILSIAVIISFISFMNTLALHSSAMDNVRANTIGTVVKCVKDETGVFSKSIDYQVYVSVHYLYKGQDCEIYKCYSVPEDVWEDYGVGDTFDASKVQYFDYTLYTTGGLKLE